MTEQDTEKGQPSARESSRIGMNLAALVFARVATLGMTLVQMGIIFRELGVEGSGQFVFALGYASLFTVFATLGIQRLLVRDIARNPAIAWTYVWTATGVMAVLSLAVYAVITGSIVVLEPNPVVRQAVLLATLSFVVLWALQCPFEALLTARERMVFIGIVYVVTGALKLLGIFVLLRHMPSSVAAHAIVAASHAIAFLLCVAFTVYVAGWERPRICLPLAWHQVRESFPFMAAMVCSQVYVKSDMSILKFMQGDATAGLYGPPQRLIEPILMIAAIWGTVVFPALCRLSVQSPENYLRLQRASMRLALFLAFPMAFGLACLAGPVVRLLAGPGYEESVVVLQLLCVIIPSFYLNGVGQELYYAAHRNWYVVSSYALAAVVSVTVNVTCIPYLGVRGVTAGAIASNIVISLIFLTGMREAFGSMRLGTFAAKTCLACAAMSVLVRVAEHFSLVLAVGVGVVAYGGLQLLLHTLDAEERGLAKRLAAECISRFTRA